MFDQNFVNGLLDFLNKGGVFGGAVLMIWLFYTERIVPASRLLDQKEATKAAIQATQDLSIAIKELTATVSDVRIAIATLGAVLPTSRKRVGGE